MLKWFKITFYSVAGAYPLSGVPFAIHELFADSLWRNNSGAAVERFLWTLIWGAIATPLGLGIAITDEGGVGRVNMYPYIFPTAVGIFVAVAVANIYSSRVERRGTA